MWALPVGSPTEERRRNSRRPEGLQAGGTGAGPSLKLACYDLPTFSCPLRRPGRPRLPSWAEWPTR